MFWIIAIIAIIVIASINGAAERQKERDMISWQKFQESESKIVIHGPDYTITHEPSLPSWYDLYYDENGEIK